MEIFTSTENYRGVNQNNNKHSLSPVRVIKENCITIKPNKYNLKIHKNTD